MDKMDKMFKICLCTAKTSELVVKKYT